METVTKGANPELWALVKNASVNSISEAVKFINDCAREKRLISYDAGEADDQLRQVIFRDLPSAPAELVHELKDAILDYICAMNEGDRFGCPYRSETLSLLWDVHRNWRASQHQTEPRLPAVPS
jgi:hypothetical protein